MMQIVEQTHEEKLAMYMKLPKKQLAEMLIECNTLLDKHGVIITNTGDKPIQFEQIFYIKL
jgi:urease beta subunit